MIILKFFDLKFEEPTNLSNPSVPQIISNSNSQTAKITTEQKKYSTPTNSNTISTLPAVWVEGIGSLSIINAPGGYPDLNGAGQVTCFYKNESLFYSLNSPFNTQCSIPEAPLDLVVYYEPNDSTWYVKNTSQVTTVTLFDVSGRKIKTFYNSNESQMTLTINDCSSGIYFLNFDFKSQKNQVVKIGVW